MFLLRSLDSLLMIAGAKFDVPLVVTPSSLSGSNFGMSAPLLACFETDLKGVVKAVSEDQFLFGVYVLVAIAAFSLAATSVWSARKGHCPLMGFARSWLLPGFLATFQHYFMEFDASVCIYLFAMFVAVSPSFFSAFSMLLPVSLVRELKSCERQEKTKQTCEVEDFMVPPCHSVGLTAVSCRFFRVVCPLCATTGALLTFCSCSSLTRSCTPLSWRRVFPMVWQIMEIPLWTYTGGR